MFGLIKKSSISELLSKENLRGYDRAGKEFQVKIERALEDQKNLYELKIQSLHSDINILESIIKDKDNKVSEASEKEKQARQIFLKAKELIDRVDYHYKEHTENSTRSMTKFKEIRIEAEEFVKKLITDN
jgi:vacuolar-type H+-ATPase subunit I/STV1